MASSASHDRYAGSSGASKGSKRTALSLPENNNENRGDSKLSTILPPLAGSCLCRDFTIIITNPRPGMILCHCIHCQINSASFFGTYITAESRNNVTIIHSQKARKHRPEMHVYDAQPEESPHRCPRTFCRGCGTLLFAEPSSISVVVVNCALFQNHKFHPALRPSLEIFTTRRSKWLSRRDDSLQAEGMPVFPAPGEESETDTETDTGYGDQVDESQRSAFWNRNGAATEKEIARGETTATLGGLKCEIGDNNGLGMGLGLKRRIKVEMIDDDDDDNVFDDDGNGKDVDGCGV